MRKHRQKVPEARGKGTAEKQGCAQDWNPGALGSGPLTSWQVSSPQDQPQILGVPEQMKARRGCLLENYDGFQDSMSRATNQVHGPVGLLGSHIHEASPTCSGLSFLNPTI